MSPAEAYKRGFLDRCLAVGADAAEIEAMAKRAFTLEDLKAPGGIAGNLAVAGTLGLFGGGVGTGYLARRALKSEFRPQDLQRRELVALYNAFADDLERDNKADAASAEEV